MIRDFPVLSVVFELFEIAAQQLNKDPQRYQKSLINPHHQDFLIITNHTAYPSL